jgi:hypothetical protein
MDLLCTKHIQLNVKELFFQENKYAFNRYDEIEEKLNKMEATILKKNTVSLYTN